MCVRVCVCMHSCMCAQTHVCMGYLYKHASQNAHVDIIGHWAGVSFSFPNEGFRVWIQGIRLGCKCLLHTGPLISLMYTLSSTGYGGLQYITANTPIKALPCSISETECICKYSLQRNGLYYNLVRLVSF